MNASIVFEIPCFSCYTHNRIVADACNVAKCEKLTRYLQEKEKVCRR